MSLETLQVGVITTVVGMGVVFVVLIFLAFLTAMLDRISTAKKKEKAPEPVVTEVPVAEETKLDAKVVAVIMAAISAATGKPVAHLKFTAIKRVNGTHTAWSDAGTAEIITTRQNYL